MFTARYGLGLYMQTRLSSPSEQRVFREVHTAPSTYFPPYLLRVKVRWGFLIINMMNECSISILAICPANRVTDTWAHGEFNLLYLKRIIARCDSKIPCACQSFRRGVGARSVWAQRTVRAGWCSTHTIVRTVAYIQEQRRPDSNQPHQRFLCLFNLKTWAWAYLRSLTNKVPQCFPLTVPSVSTKLCIDIS